MKKFPFIASFLMSVLLLAIPTYAGARQQSNDQSVEQKLSESEAGEEDTSRKVLEGRKITLKDGSEVIIADIPDSLTKKTKVRFNKEGKADISCH